MQELNSSTRNTIALLEETEDFEADQTVYSNRLVPLLDAAAPSLRQLRLTIGEPPVDEGPECLAAALLLATGLTSLELRFTSEEWTAQDATRLDCHLLGGMSQLRHLRTDAAGRLDGLAALAALTLADVVLEGPAALPAIAPHAPGLTRLELGGCRAAALHGAEAAVGQALHSLIALRCLALGRREELSLQRSPEAEAAAREVQERRAEAVTALHALLPPGCEVEAAPPAVHLWG